LQWTYESGGTVHKQTPELEFEDGTITQSWVLGCTPAPPTNRASRRHISYAHIGLSGTVSMLVQSSCAIRLMRGPQPRVSGPSEAQRRALVGLKAPSPGRN